MSRLPWVLRGGSDPLETRRRLAEGADILVKRLTTAIAGSAGGPLVVTAATLDALAATDTVGDLISTEELARAAERASIDLADVDTPALEELRGYLSALRGAAGENFVVDRLAAGGLPLPDGAERVTLEPFTTPGVDLHIVGHGLDTAANVKIAGDADVILRHFAVHAEQVPIVYASSDAAIDAASRGLHVIGAGDAIDLADGPVVIDIGVPSSSFDAEITPYLDGEDVAAGFELADFPFFSAGMIVVRAIARIRAGATAADAARAAGGDVIRAGVTLATGKTATLVGLPHPAAAAATITAGLAASAAIEVRRTWLAAADDDTRLAALADSFVTRWTDTQTYPRGIAPMVASTFRPHGR